MMFISLSKMSIDEKDPGLLKELKIRPAGVGVIYVMQYIVCIFEFVEQIVLRNIKFALYIPFWYVSNGCKVLDGTWLLDGSILLDSVRNYDLRLWIKCYIGKLRIRLFNEMKKICMRLRQNEKEAIINNQLVICCKARTRNKSKAKICIAFKINVQECFAGAAVIQRRNLWYLDGTYNLDGTRFLNAEYKKEEI